MWYIFLMKEYWSSFVFSMVWNLKHGFSLGICVYNVLSTCFYIICVLNSTLSDNILYLVTFNFKLAKKQNGCKNVKKPKYFLCFFAHESTIESFWKIFIIYFFLVSLEGNNLDLTFKYNISVVFHIFTVLISIPLKCWR